MANFCTILLTRLKIISVCIMEASSTGAQIENIQLNNMNVKKIPLSRKQMTAIGGYGGGLFQGATSVILFCVSMCTTESCGHSQTCRRSVI